MHRATPAPRQLPRSHDTLKETSYDDDPCARRFRHSGVRGILPHCGGAAPEAPEPATCAPSTTTATTTTSRETSVTESAAPAPTVTVTETQPAPEPVGPSIAERTAGVGDPVDVFGEPAVVCVIGDGHGVSHVAAGANTSCEFAYNTIQAVINTLPEGGLYIQPSLPRSVVVYSPVTGEEYTMNCAAEPSGLATCRGGNGASVFMY